jgi:hypothetical protein
MKHTIGFKKKYYNIDDKAKNVESRNRENKGRIMVNPCFAEFYFGNLEDQERFAKPEFNITTQVYFEMLF